MPATPDARFSNVCFTYNNPGPDLLATPALLYKENAMAYLVFQLEQGANGTPHFQGYIELKKRKTLGALKKLLGASPHFEERLGSQEQAINYCKKADTRVDGPWEFGEAKKQGKRNDLVDLIKLSDRGVRPAIAKRQLPVAYARHYRMYAHLLTLERPPRRPREVILLIGAPGAGKTTYVLDRYPDAYVTPVDAKGFWFDGYEGHDVALIDDYSGQWPLKSLLRVLHEYPERLPVKGGFVWWNPSKIYITTNENWNTWYKREGSDYDNFIGSLGRRIHKTITFPFLQGEPAPEPDVPVLYAQGLPLLPALPVSEE